MDITYTSEFDATRYERLIDRALGIGTFRDSFFCWCMAVFGVSSLYYNWARHYDFGVWDWLYVILAVNPLLLRAIRRFQARQYLMVLQRVMCGATASRCRLTDEGYEVSCGETSQKMSWKSLAFEFHFFDDDTVALLQVKGLPSLVLSDLSKHGIARKELESVLLHAGVKERRASGLRKFCTGVSGIVGFLFVIVALLKALGSLISPCGHGQLVFSNESAVSVAKALVTFGRNAIELKDIPSQGEKVDDFFVGGACNCHVVATLADGLVVSNSYGYYCHGHDWGRVDVIVTQDKRIKIVDKYYREDIERKHESGESIDSLCVRPSEMWKEWDGRQYRAKSVQGIVHVQIREFGRIADVCSDASGYHRFCVEPVSADELRLKSSDVGSRIIRKVDGEWVLQDVESQYNGK